MTTPFAATATAASAPPAAQPWRAGQPGRSRSIGPADPMPYGRHKGVPIEQVERSYLQWALRNMDACNPAHERHWPELTAVLEGIVGVQDPLLKPAPTIGLPALCVLLAGRGIRISAKAGELVTSEAVTDEELRDGLRVHKAVLLALVAIVEPRSAAGNGSAKLLWAADLRCRIKAWYGAMSRQFHPDHGGSADSQKAVNQSYRSLMEVLSEWEGTK